MANRLAGETSPYLLQHAGNPVDWYPWGEEAFRVARERDVPVMLSVGYSACHWCHVMERESFEDAETAAILNEGFVSVKVDREERPDVDAIYMRAVQSMTGHGGWPLTAFLTPDGEPFYGGTYYPPEPRHGMPSFGQVLRAIREAWERERDRVADSAARMKELLERSTTQTPTGSGGRVSRALAAAAVRGLASRHDREHGGFGSAPKFPQPLVLDFLLRHHARTGDRVALDTAVRTLRRMAAGGMRDHLGGGFHRYSVDEAWLVPHFEKMLYDQALLARAYLAGWQVTGDALFRRVAEETLDWVLADLRTPEGGFHSAWDADSEGEEGLYYLWTPADLEEALDPGEARLFGRVYDVREGGNFEGRSILHLPRDPGAVARDEGVEPAELRDRLARARARLLEVRAGRVPPLRDHKVLAGWNAMTVRALAEAGGALERDDYTGAAEDGGRFLLESLTRDGRLHHVWTDGRLGAPAFLEDEAASGLAFLALHETTLDPRWLGAAKAACEAILERFWEEADGAFFDTARDAETLVVRPREVMDTATPAGTSLAVELLLRASHLFGEQRFRRPAVTALERELPLLESHPLGFGRLLACVEMELSGPVEVAVVGRRGEAARDALLAAALRPFLAARTVTGREPDQPVPDDVPLLEGREPVDGRPTAWLCRNYACEAPTTDPGTLAEQLRAAAEATRTG